MMELEQTGPETWQSFIYRIVRRRARIELFGLSKEITQLDICRRDEQPCHNWSDLQDIKNQLHGPENEALELYPAESRLVDPSNHYLLWCVPKGIRLPIGHTTRVTNG